MPVLPPLSLTLAVVAQGVCVVMACIFTHNAPAPGLAGVDVGVCMGPTLTPTHPQPLTACSPSLATAPPICVHPQVSFVPIVNPLFHHPWDTMTPIIMIGAGTGIAPFRGFWQERMVMVEHGEKMGECVLLFGCQRRDTDFLFEDEINAAVEAGAITHFLPALSQQPGIPKTYVQDLILQNKEVWFPVSQGLCHWVYSCPALLPLPFSLYPHVQTTMPLPHRSRLVLQSANDTKVIHLPVRHSPSSREQIG